MESLQEIEFDFDPDDDTHLGSDISRCELLITIRAPYGLVYSDYSPTMVRFLRMMQEFLQEIYEAVNPEYLLVVQEGGVDEDAYIRIDKHQKLLLDIDNLSVYSEKKKTGWGRSW